MNKYDFIPRIIENKDWVTVLFLMSLSIIAITKSAFQNRFSDFANLLVSDKYLKIYKDSSNLMTWFTILLFVVQLISFSYFIQLIMTYLKYTTKTNWITFIQIFTLMSFFILSKFLIEKIIATSFNIENVVEQFNLFKVSYRTCIGLFLLPVNIVLFYTDFLNYYVIVTLLAILLIINIITYLLSLRNYQKLLISKMFYFILYICTLEIAPYYFIYYVMVNR